MKDNKPIIGIIGGVCSGKSTVAREFAHHGCAIINADKIVHDLLGEETIKNEIVEFFGKDVLDDNHAVDRGTLAEKVFSSQENVDRINQIVHPPVMAITHELIEKLNANEEVGGIVLDVPLLIEAGWSDRCDCLVFVDCPDEIRARRAAEKGISFQNQVKKRENFQISLDKKAQVAHHIINNNSDLSVLAEQVAKVFSIINSE